MATSFPTNIDSFTNPDADDKRSSPSHAAQHADVNDAVEAIETKVGKNGSAVTTSHDYKLSGVSAGDKAVSLTGAEILTNKTLTSPKVNENISVTATASELNFLDGVQVWTMFTPSWTNLTVGNGTNVGRYTKVGKTVHYYVHFTLGSTSAVSGTPIFSLPVAKSTSVDNLSCIGMATLTDNGGASGWYVGFQVATGMIYLYSVAGTYLGGGTMSSTVPFTWAENDEIIVRGAYEAA